MIRVGDGRAYLFVPRLPDEYVFIIFIFRYFKFLRGEGGSGDANLDCHMFIFISSKQVRSLDGQNPET